LTHYLLKTNLASCFEKVLQYNFNYFSTPTSPFERLSFDTAAPFIQCLKNMIEQYDVQILMKIGLRDLKQITKFPEETALEFFQLLEIEDFTNFTKERTQELKQNPTSLLLQDINPRFFDPSTEALIKSKMLFDDSKPSFTPARIYGLVLPIYPVGS